MERVHIRSVVAECRFNQTAFWADDAYKLYTFVCVLYIYYVKRVKIIKILFSVKNGVFVRIIRAYD